jgi:hypothetical protein
MVEFYARNRNRKQKFLSLERALKTEGEHDRILVPACAGYAAVEEAVLQQRFENGSLRRERKPVRGPVELLESHTRDEFTKIRS